MVYQLSKNKRAFLSGTSCTYTIVQQDPFCYQRYGTGLCQSVLRYGDIIFLIAIPKTDLFVVSYDDNAIVLFITDYIRGYL